MNKLFPSLALTLFLLTSATPAYAHPWRFHLHGRAEARSGVEEETEKEEENQEKARAEEIRAKVAEFKQAKTDRQLALLKELCGKMVLHRQRELNRLQVKVDNSELSDTQKEEINTTIKSKEASLVTAKSDCDKETNTERLKTRIRDVQRKERVFHANLPKLHGMKFVRHADAFVARLDRHTAKVEAKINEAEAAGCDVTDAQAAFVDYKAAVEEAKTHLAKALDLVNQIKDGEDPGDLRDQLKAELQAIIDALKKAHDAHKIIKEELRGCPPQQKTTPTAP